jgi:hypothetical protein
LDVWEVVVVRGLAVLAVGVVFVIFYYIFVVAIPKTTAEPRLAS